MEIDVLVEGAMKYLENKIRIGDWSARSLLWARIDLELTPDLAFNED